MEPSPAAERFPCSFGGAIAAGRRRLRALLLGLALLMLVLAAWTLTAGRVLPGLLSAAVAFLLWTAWRMSGELEPIWIALEEERLVLRTRRSLLELPRAGLEARALSADERAHLERLASHAFVVAASGGFDSHLLGEFDLYASDLQHALLIEAGDTRLVVTPDDPERFLAALARS